MKLPKKRRTEITIETRSVTIIRARGKKISAACQHCRKTTEVVTIEQSAARLNITTVNVYSLIETGELHFLRIAESQVLPFVCGNSLGAVNKQLIFDFLKS